MFEFVESTDGTFDVQRWSDVPCPQNLPGVGEEVSLPLQVTAYVQTGVAKVRYAWREEEPVGCF